MVVLVQVHINMERLDGSLQWQVWETGESWRVSNTELELGPSFYLELSLGCGSPSIPFRIGCLDVFLFCFIIPVGSLCFTWRRLI